MFELNECYFCNVSGNRGVESLFTPHPSACLYSKCAFVSQYHSEFKVNCNAGQNRGC